GLVLVVDPDFLDLGRAEGLGDELGDILTPLDDVDLLAAQLVDHLADPGAAGADAGTLGVDVGVVGDHGDLGAVTGLAGDGDDLHGAVGQLRHLQLEEAADQVGVAPGHDDLGAFGVVAHLEDQGLDAVAALETLEGDSLAGGQIGLGVTEVEDHRAGQVDLLDDAGDEVAFPALVHVEYLLALGLAQLELHDLLEGLRGEDRKSTRLNSS